MASKNTSNEFIQYLAMAKVILNRISARWPISEQVRGGVGSNPAVATLILPQSEWNILTRDDQISLTFYAEVMVDDVRINPTKYITIPSTAAVYQEMLEHYRYIQDGFWEIVVGRIKDEETMNLMVDKSLVRGDEFWDFDQGRFGVRASIFRHEDFLSSSDSLMPNSENAIVDIRKLRDYCLNPEHDDGKHKARLFLSTLGMNSDHAEDLRQILLDVVKKYKARLGRQDEFGQRYTLDFPIEWQNRSAVLRSGWIIEHGSEVPRLTTCYPL
ncbi:MAG: hypothetical protein OHK0012_12930 [Synechococcales cyanobacterium]